MKKLFRLLAVAFIISTTLAVLGNTADASGCYVAATGGFVDIGGQQVFVCPGPGETACLYLKDPCPEQ
jgi:hypothetical protein